VVDGCTSRLPLAAPDGNGGESGFNPLRGSYGYAVGAGLPSTSDLERSTRPSLSRFELARPYSVDPPS
jgi:hypothetical protein